MKLLNLIEFFIMIYLLSFNAQGNIYIKMNITQLLCVVTMCLIIKNVEFNTKSKIFYVVAYIQIHTQLLIICLFNLYDAL